MKKSDFSNINPSPFRTNFIMFIETLDEVLFYYSFESYKLPALNAHYLCRDILTAKSNIDNDLITEGNFIPLAEEFERTLETDIVLRKIMPEIDMLLKRRDKLGNTIDYTKADLKAKIRKYSEAARYICDVCQANSMYLTTILDMIMENVFASSPSDRTSDNIYYLTRSFATELVNGGYSPEYISTILHDMFQQKTIKVDCVEQSLIDFFNNFTFNEKSYQVVFGINTETAKILKHVKKGVSISNPSASLKRKLELKHRSDQIIIVSLKGLDEHEAAATASIFVNTAIGLHRISQHHKPTYIKSIAIVRGIEETSEGLKELSSSTIRLRKNVLLRANNENQIQSFFYDEQLLNEIEPPATFFRAVGLHNSALDSKEPTNQLLDLWTAVETLIGFKAGDEDKISVISDILASILNRAYLFSQISQLYKDILAVLDGDSSFLSDILSDEQPICKLAKIMCLDSYASSCSMLLNKLDEYPLLQYRIQRFSKVILVDSKSIYAELTRHRDKIRWQIMRIYRNRNMIVHNGNYMPYLHVILGNLHYYLDAMFDVLIEYYHLGIDRNQSIFFHIQKEELRYWNILGLDDKGKKISSVPISDLNLMEMVFNGYEGNTVKNSVNQAIAKMKAEQNDLVAGNTMATKNRIADVHPII